MESPTIVPDAGSDDEYNSDQAPDEPTDPTIVEGDSDAESDADSELGYASDPELEANNEPPIQTNMNEEEQEEQEEEEEEADDDEEDTISENYDEFLQKIDKQYTTNIVDEYHNEEYHINPDEMTKLCQIKKNSKGFIDDPLHKTSPIMTKYEYTNIIGLRTKQLGDGASLMIDIPEGVMENFIIAEIELKQKVLPFVVKRPLGHGGCEYWRISDLEILF